MSTIGELRTSYTARGIKKYEVEVSHAELHKYQKIRGDDRYTVNERAKALAAQWDEMWKKRSAIEKARREREAAAKDLEAKKKEALDRTEEAREAIEQIRNTLAATLEVDDAIDWESLKDTSAYSAPKPSMPAAIPAPVTPNPPPKPMQDHSSFRPQISLLDRLVPSRRAAREAEARQAYEQACAEWQTSCDEQTREHQKQLNEHAKIVKKQKDVYQQAVRDWEKRARCFAEEQKERNALVDQKKARYMGADPEAISEYCSMVLDNSSYPDYFPQSFQVDFNPANGIVVVDYQLPAPGDLPLVTEVKYVKSSDSFVEKRMSQSQANGLYDSLLYQIALRTVHELFEADTVNVLQAVVFNGWVHSVDSSTGQEVDSCVLSIQVGREEFKELNLASVDPRACFKKLKGVGSARLHSLAAVAPLLTISQEDKRFVSSYAVAEALAEGDNLAAMDWEDFEHLIRELFEKEFSAVGGEVKVTRASHDGGVDAIVFDPDPLRGGKTVIQAKRYTNTVTVAAVRDLYGTVMNEGANKGILVTTSDYGPDAYEFAKGKPLVLLNGGNLLHMLGSHGHKARIDLAEAKKAAAEAQARARP